MYILRNVLTASWSINSATPEEAAVLVRVAGNFDAGQRIHYLGRVTDPDDSNATGIKLNIA